MSQDSARGTRPATARTARDGTGHFFPFAGVPEYATLSEITAEREEVGYEPGVLASGLVKNYGSARAVDGLDLAVPEGTMVGLLGPNGAGKTTTVRMLSTLLAPDSGECTVAGIDVIRYPRQARRMLGLAGQSPSSIH